MKICAAQIKSARGDVEKNILHHLELIHMAIENSANLVVFPELSVTNYEPDLAASLATNKEDKLFVPFQLASDKNNLTICIGMPLKAGSGIQIGMIVFQPGKPRHSYAKQCLHADELPYFVPGEQPFYFDVAGSKIAPAICYESMLAQHSADANKNGAAIYMASVAKNVAGVERGMQHYPAVADKYGMTVMMVNNIGPCDNFVSIGNSAVWNSKGVLVGQLNNTDEGLLFYDTVTQTASHKMM